MKHFKTYGQFISEGKDIDEAKLNEISTKAGLDDIIKGRTSSIEGMKMSKELAQGMKDWIAGSAYGRKYGKQVNKGRIHSVLSVANSWGIERYLDKKAKKEWKELYKNFVVNANVNDTSKKSDELNERKFTEEERKELAKKGLALPNGSFPIVNVEDLKAAILSYGMAKNRSEAAKWIAKRAKALGAEDLLPDTPDFNKALKEVETRVPAKMIAFDLEDEEDEAMEEADKNWSDDVKTKNELPEGTFTKSAKEIADTLKKYSDDLKQAMSRLNFYINRGGKGLDKKTIAELEKAKELLRKLY